MQTGFTRNLRSLKKRSFLGQLVATLLACEILFFASFVSFTLPTPNYRNLQRFVYDTQVELVDRFPEPWRGRIHEKFPILDQPMQNVRYSTYVPLLPLAMALAYVLGFPLAVMATGLHFLLGIIGAPANIFLFASGGGTSYWHEPGFGYLLGIIAGAWFAAWISPEEERKSWRQLLAAFGGVSITHFVGLTFVFSSSIGVLLFEGETAYLQFQPWLAEQIRNLSWYSLPYDLLFATILIALAFPLRWLFGILTSPDISHKHRPSVETQLETLQETTVY